MPISAPDTITLAVQHTKRQLFQPFRFWQWTRLALVGLLAGEMGSAGNFHVPSTWKPNQHPSQHFLPSAFPNIDPAILGALIAVLLITGLVFMIVMMYINSVMRFILFDSVLVKECHIRGGWSRARAPVGNISSGSWALGFSCLRAWSCSWGYQRFSPGRRDGLPHLATTCCP